MVYLWLQFRHRLEMTGFDIPITLNVQSAISFLS